MALLADDAPSTAVMWGRSQYCSSTQTIERHSEVVLKENTFIGLQHESRYIARN